MINTILDVILNLLFFIIELVLKLVMLIFPKFTLVDQFATLIDSFFGLINGASTMTYFLIGDLTPALVTFALTLLLVKHIVLPTVNIVRKFIDG